MRKRTKLFVFAVMPFTIAFCALYYLRVTGNDRFLYSEQYFTSGYKGCFVPEQPQGDNFKTIPRNGEFYLYINPVKTGKIKLETAGKNSIKITYDDTETHTLQVCPTDVVARVSLYEVSSDYFDKPEASNNSSKYLKTFEGTEEIEVTVEEKRAVYIRMENFPAS
jgi:hypothetical protein